MDGGKLAKQAKEIDPAFPIIYMTGAAAAEWASPGVPKHLLTKRSRPMLARNAGSYLIMPARSSRGISRSG